MEKTEVLLGIIMVLSLFLLIFMISSFFGITGDAVVEMEDGFSVGENISGKLKLEVEKEDNLTSETLVSIFLIKNNTILKKEILTMGEFVGDLEETRLKPGVYEADIEKVFPYTLNEEGKHKLTFTIMNLDKYTQIKFNVKSLDKE